MSAKPIGIFLRLPGSENLDPRMDLEDSSSCGESHLVPSDFKEMTFLWGDHSMGASFFFWGGISTEKQHCMYAFYVFCEGFPKLTYF